MNCRLVELRHKEVINKQNGCRIGFVDDLEVDTCNAKVCSLIIFGRGKCFGLLGRGDDFIIPWDKIEVIGEDTILVNSCNFNHNRGKKRRMFLKNF